MPECPTIDPLVTPYVDGELPAADRQMVDDHLRRCVPCRTRVTAEQAVHRLMRAGQPVLQSERAPETLRARCAALAATRLPRAVPAAAAPTWRTRLAPFAMAASLVGIVGAGFLYQLTEQSNRALAAELAADHVKCFMLNAALPPPSGSREVQRSLAAKFGWSTHLPDAAGADGLELVGERTCLYGEGRVAHVMYRRGGRPVSLFMLPHDVRNEEVVAALGHEAAIWSSGDRSFVVVAREPRVEVERIATFVRAGLR